MFTSIRNSLRVVAAIALVAACGGGDSGGPAPVPQGFTVSLSSTTLSVEQGASGTITATIGRTGSFSGTVNLGTEGLPTGITASFSPSAISSSTTSTTLTVTVAATVNPGPYTFTIRGQASGLSDQTATVSMTVTAKPAIAMALAPTSATVQQGANTSYTATITRTNFTGAVAVAVTGAPTGVTTAVTNAADVFTVAVTVGAATAPGTYTLTTTATGAGVAGVTGAFALTVTTAPTSSIALTANPTALTAQAGGAGVTSTITITRNNFTGAVTLATNTIGTGITAAFSASPTTANTSVLTITAATNAAAGSYPVTVTGSGTGIASATVQLTLTVTAAAGSITLSANPTTVNATAGGNAVTTTVTIARSNFAGDVTLAASGVPNGATATFAPATTTGTTSTLTITVPASVTGGTYPIGITGTGSGITTANLQISLVVASASSISLAATNITVQQGQSGTSNVTITRSNFAGAVTLTATTAASNVTLTVNGSPASGTTASIGVVVGAALTPGNYTVTVTGAGAGIANATTTFTLTVQQASSGGNITFSFCGATSVLPIWVAAQNGAGAWQRVTAGTNNTYSFNVTSTGGIAYVTQDGTDSYALTIVYGTAAELGARGAQNCVSPITKTVTGTTAGIAVGDNVSVNFGGASPQTSPTVATPNFTITGAPDGMRDLIATRGGIDLMNIQAGFVTNKIFLKRGLNPANNGSVGTVDFGGSDAFDPETKTLTVAGANSGEFVISQGSFSTANGSSIFLGGTNTNTTNVAPYKVVPSAKTISGDLHILVGSASTLVGNSVTAQRSVLQYLRNPGDATVTLGAVLSTPTFSTLSTTGYARIRGVLARQSEYNDFYFMNFGQAGAVVVASASIRNFSVQLSAGYLGSATTVDVSVPDFSGVAGWQNLWGPIAGTPGQTSFIASGFVQGGGTTADGSIAKSASRFGNYTP